MHGSQWPVVLVVIYSLYVHSHLRAEADIVASDLAPLRFARSAGGAAAGQSGAGDLGSAVAAYGPSPRAINVQVLVALGLIIGGSVVFVEAIEGLAHSLNVAPLILALVVAPIATELPEKLNSVIWVRSGKDTLAMGNITGAMVFQACIPTIGRPRLRLGRVAGGAGLVGVAGGLRLGCLRVHLDGGRSSCRWRGRAGCAAAACWPGGVFYLAFLVLAVAVGAGLA